MGNMVKATVLLSLLIVQAIAIAGLADWGRVPIEAVRQQLIPAEWAVSQELADPAVDRELQSQIEDYLKGLQGRYGVAVRNLDDGRIALVNAEERLEAASMYKLLVMYRVLQQVDRGELQLHDTIEIEDSDTVEAAAYDLAAGEEVTVESALEQMISISSNSAAYALSRAVGGWGMVNSAAPEIGMAETYWDEGYWSSPHDMMEFFEDLADRRLISREASNHMVELLLMQQVNDRIPALLPEQARVAHKTGELEGVRNDGGIVSSPGGRYVIVVMSDGVNPARATEAIAEISRLVYERYG